MGVFDRLLDHVYATEKMLPGDVEACCRIARAMDKAERKAVESVLQQFFVLDGGLYTNARAAEEIAKAQPKIEAAKANGLKGGRPKRTEQKPSGLPDGLPPGTHEEPNSKALQNQSSNTSVPYGTGAQAPPDPADSIFALGVPMLTAAGVSERNSRSMLGLMRKTHGDTAVVGALQRCAEEKPLQPVAWLQAALKAPVTKFDRVVNASVAETAEYLRQQAAHKAERPPPEVMAKLKGVIRSVA